MINNHLTFCTKCHTPLRAGKAFGSRYSNKVSEGDGDVVEPYWFCIDCFHTLGKENLV